MNSVCSLCVAASGVSLWRADSFAAAGKKASSSESSSNKKKKSVEADNLASV